MRHDRDWHLTEAERLLAMAVDERDLNKQAVLGQLAGVHVLLARELAMANGKAH